MGVAAARPEVDCGSFKRRLSECQCRQRTEFVGEEARRYAREHLLRRGREAAGVG